MLRFGDYGSKTIAAEHCVVVVVVAVMRGEGWCALPRDEMWLVQEALRMRGRFSWCDHRGVRGSPPLDSPTRRLPRPPQPRSLAPYRRSRSWPVLCKSIRRLHPWSMEPPRESMRGRVVKKDGNFADEWWPRRCEFGIRDRFVIDRFCPGVVDGPSSTRGPWLWAASMEEKKDVTMLVAKMTLRTLPFVDRCIYRLGNFLKKFTLYFKITNGSLDIQTQLDV